MLKLFSLRFYFSLYILFKNVDFKYYLAFFLLFFFPKLDLKAESFSIAELNFDCVSCKKVNVEGLEIKKSERFFKEFCYHELEGLGKIVSCLELSEILINQALRNKKVFQTGILLNHLELLLNTKAKISNSYLDSLLYLLFLSPDAEEKLLESLNRLNSGQKKIIFSRLASDKFKEKLKVLWKKELDLGAIQNINDRYYVACKVEETSLSNILSGRFVAPAKDILVFLEKIEKRNFNDAFFDKTILFGCSKLSSLAIQTHNFFKNCTSSDNFHKCSKSEFPKYYLNLEDVNHDKIWFENLQQELLLNTSTDVSPKKRLQLLSQINYQKRRTPHFHEILEKTLLEIKESEPETIFINDINKMIVSVSRDDQVINNLYNSLLPKELMPGSNQNSRFLNSKTLLFCLLLFLIFLFSKFSKISSNTKREEYLLSLREKEKAELFKYFEANEATTQKELTRNFKEKAKNLHPDNSFSGSTDEFNRLYERHEKLQKILFG